MDFGGRSGSPILAAADATTIKIRGRISHTSGCGLGITIYHPALDRWTAYCHLSRIVAEQGPVKRGQVIGYMGISGSSQGVPHLHFEVVTDGKSHRDGDLKNTEDPQTYLVGCFSKTESYAPKQLTYPVPCKD